MAGCGPKDIYDELIRQGFSTVQAVGVMANMINESSLNVETGAGGHTIDNNGYPVYGLVSWNTGAGYPNAGALVTGNCANDLKQQIGFLKQSVSGRALEGTTAAEVASNFAQYYEICQGCAPGGAQNASRVNNAATVASWVSSGKWPVSSKGVSTAPGSTAPGASGGATSTCITGTVFGYCPLTNSEARALIGGALMVAGGMLVLPGLLMLAAFGFRSPGGQAAAGQAAAVAERTPGYGQAIRYARTRSQNRAARAQGARREELRQYRAAGRKQARAGARKRPLRAAGGHSRRCPRRLLGGCRRGHHGGRKQNRPCCERMLTASLGRAAKHT